MFNQTSLIIWTVGAALLVLAYACALTGWLAVRAARRPDKVSPDKVSSDEARRVEMDRLWDELRDTQRANRQLRQVVEDNACICDDDRAACRRRHADARPSPRHAMAERTPRLAQLALPAPPPRLDLDAPAWAGQTRTFDRLAARHPAVLADLVPLPPVAASAPPAARPLADDDTATIPVIVDEILTGELVA